MMTGASPVEVDDANLSAQLPLPLGDKSEARQTPFNGKGMDDGHESLRFLELSFPFELDQLIPVPGTGLIPPFGDDRVIFCHIKCAYQRKARFLDQSFILTGWGEEKVPDGTPDGDLLVREHASDDNWVSEEQAATWTQDTRPLLQDLQATGQMINGVKQITVVNE
jgi:hypothetical protein